MSFSGLVTGVSSSEELSSEAPRMNLRRSLDSDPEPSLGAVGLEGFSIGCGELITGSVVLASAGGPASSPCAEVVGAADGEGSSGPGVRAAHSSSSAAGGAQPGGDSSPFSGIATVLVLVLHSSNNIHRINPKTANGSIHRHPPETATTERTMEISLQLCT